MHDRPDVQLLGGDQREAGGQVEAHLPAEHRARAGAGAVALGRAVLEDVPQQLEVLPHPDQAARKLPEGCALPVGDRQHRQAGQDHRQRQQLPHRHPVEEQVAEVRVRHAHELDREAEHAVADQEQAGRRPAEPRLRGEPPQDEEQHQAFERGLVQLRGVQRHAVDDHGPGHVGGLAPQFAVDEIADAAGAEADRRQRGGEIEHVDQPLAAALRKPCQREQHAEQAAVEGHAAFPDRAGCSAARSGSFPCRRTASSRAGRRGSRRRHRRR